MASWSPFQSKLFCKTVSLFASLFFQQPYLVHFSLQKQWTFTINAPVVPIYYILVVIARQLWCTQTGFHQCNTKFEVSLQDTPNALHSKVRHQRPRQRPFHCIATMHKQTWAVKVPCNILNCCFKEIRVSVPSVGYDL